LNEGAGCVFYVPKTGTISKIGFRTGTVTTADDFTVALETVSATDGMPSGTNYGGSAAGTQTIVPTDDDLWFWTALGTAATATEGDLVALRVNIVFVNGNMQISHTVTNLGTSIVPYSLLHQGSWSKGTNIPNFAIEYSDGSRPYIGTNPTTIQSNTTFNSASTPDERGNRFKLPFACRVWGAAVRLLQSTANTTYAVKLYDCSVTDAGTLIAQRAALDTDIYISTSAGSVRVRLIPESGQSLVLYANRLYRLTVLPETTGDITNYRQTVDSTGTLEAMPGGVEWYHTERTDAGAWTQTDTQVTHIGLIIDQLDDGAYGGMHAIIGQGIGRGSVR
jgi:hypothetical protein